MNTETIKSPTLVLDEQKCRINIQRMVRKARRHELAFRPHFKTHQSGIISSWLKEDGVEKCTVSSAKMAGYFADQGWTDILIAFPVNVREHEVINELAASISLTVLVFDMEPLQTLVHHLKTKVGVKIELDLGSNRSGLQTDQYREIDELLSFIEGHPMLRFSGFYSHPGHTYTARSSQEVEMIYDGFLPGLIRLQEKYADVNGCYITVGDTPGCTLVEDFGPIREISPGNFVFYDVMQVNIGSCNYDEIAVVMACPVVAKKDEHNELLIHGGAIHFSKEVLTDADGIVHFGKLAKANSAGWEGTIEGCYLKSISQEHGLVHATDELMKKVRIGDLLYIYPVHSCLSADLVKSYLTTKGELLTGENAFMQ